MSVNTLNTSDTYVGNNSTTTPYPISFEREVNNHVFMTVDGAVYSDFSVTVGGVVTNTAIPNASTVVIYRSTPVNQLQALVANTTPRASVVENMVDKTVFILQELWARIGEVNTSILDEVEVLRSDLIALADEVTLLNNALANTVNGDPTNLLPRYNSHALADADNTLADGSKYQLIGDRASYYKALSSLPEYEGHTDADADNSLLSNQEYTLENDRAIYIKP